MWVQVPAGFITELERQRTEAREALQNLRQFLRNACTAQWLELHVDDDTTGCALKELLEHSEELCRKWKA